MTTGKTIASTRWTSVGKVMSLLFNMLSGLVTAFLPRSKCLLILWLKSLSAVIWEPKKIKSVTVSAFSPSICREVMGPDAMILVHWMLSFKPALSLSSFTLKSLLPQCSSKASILQHSAFFMVQFSHPYMTTGKTITLTRWNFVIKVMSLLFNMLSQFVMPFLLRSKHLLILWLQSRCTVIFGVQENKICSYFHFFPI